MRELQALFADIPYEQGKPVEAYFRNLMFLVFRIGVNFSTKTKRISKWLIREGVE